MWGHQSPVGFTQCHTFSAEFLDVSLCAVIVIRRDTETKTWQRHMEDCRFSHLQSNVRRSSVKRLCAAKRMCACVCVMGLTTRVAAVVEKGGEGGGGGGGSWAIVFLPDPHLLCFVLPFLWGSRGKCTTYWFSVWSSVAGGLSSVKSLF